MATASLHEMPVANRQTMRDFLAQIIGDHIHLVAMKPDDDPYPAGRWFGADADHAANWAADQNGIGKNVYWTVNRTSDGLHKKPKKTDITSARFLHVDLDPPKDGSDWDRSAAQESLETFDPPPSFILDSGGGFGGFWRLEYEAENWPAIEALNQSLEDQFGGDHCWNIDRLMRVPGTVNYPNAAKRARGRGVSLASVARADNGDAVDPKDMRCVLPAPKPRKDAKRERVALDGVTVLTPADLGITTLNRLLMMIEKPDKLDRSDATWAVACEMVRQGFTDAQIAGILLNPDLAISASPLEKASPMREVTRTIGGARRDVVFDPGNGEPGHLHSRQDVANDGETGERSPTLVTATPYIFRLPETIKPREWVYGRSIQRGHVRAIVAQGGAGKTILSVGEALAMATGRNLLGQMVPGGPKRVWLWNLEDDRDELARIIQAACKHWQISEDDIGGRLFVDSALDGAILKLASSTASGGLLINRPLVAALTDEMKSKGIDYLHVDPFVSSHAANENDNMEVDAIAKEWAQVAKNADAAVGLAHHISKSGAAEASAMHARGAVALINACRSVLVLNRMNEQEADKYGIEEERRRRFFRVFDDKNNRAPPSDASDWFQMFSINLGNDPSGGDGDSIGVVVPWSPPDAFEGVTADHLLKVQKAVAERGEASRYRVDVQASAWIGKVVADVLDLSPEASVKGDRRKINSVLRTWFETGALVKVEGKDAKSNDRTFAEVGTWAVQGLSPPQKSEVRKGGEGEEDIRPHLTSPIKGGGGEDGTNGQERQVGKPAYVQGNPALGIERPGHVVFPPETDGAALARQMLAPLPEHLRDPFDPSDEDY